MKGIFDVIKEHKNRDGEVVSTTTIKRVTLTYRHVKSEDDLKEIEAFILRTHGGDRLQFVDFE